MDIDMDPYQMDIEWILDGSALAPHPLHWRFSSAAHLVHTKDKASQLHS